MAAADDPERACGCDGHDQREQRAGQPSIRYRLGTHHDFFDAMTARIAPFSPHAGPATRDTRDGAVALLDAFAMVCDVLSFYQERIANEGYLGTATERRSLVELGRQVGYELGAGVSAQTHLAFFLEDAAGAPAEVSLPAGTQVGSVPRRKEVPKVYETLSPLEAHVAWNTLSPAQLRPQELLGSWAILTGAALRLERGDVLLLVGPKQQVVATVAEVRVDSARGQTWVSWTSSEQVGTRTPEVFVFRQRAAVFGHNAPAYSSVYQPPTTSRTLAALVSKRAGIEVDTRRSEWPGFALAGSSVDLDNAYPKLAPGAWVVVREGDEELVAVASSVEHGALADFALSSKSSRVVLTDASGKQVSLAKFSRRRASVHVEPERLELASAPETSPLSGNVLTLDRAVPALPRGKTLIVAGRESERVRAGRPLAFVAVDGAAGKLAPGEPVQVVADPVLRADGKLGYRLARSDGTFGDVTVRDEAIERPTATVGEVVTVFESSRTADGRTQIRLTEPLRYTYDRRSVRVFGNAVLAGHGETVAAEVLGSGDALQPVQRFTLQRKPLTRAWSDGKVESALEVQVAGVRWSEAPSLYGLGASAERYEVHTEDDGATTLVFGGDAAPLPTGSENVVARYRVGTGVEGAVGASELTALKTPVLGVRGVTNPLPAAGGGDPETVAQARLNVPLYSTTLERIVSLSDFEDFLRSQPGVAKVAATPVWSGTSRLVHLTVALADGTPLAAGSTLELDLQRAVRRAGGFGQPFRIEGHVPRAFAVSAGLMLDPRRDAEKVMERVREVLLRAFGFDARALSQAVTATEVLGCIQGVPGVTAVTLGALGLVGAGAGAPRLRSIALVPGATERRLRGGVASVLPAAPAGYGRGGVRAAELLLIDPQRIVLTSRGAS